MPELCSSPHMASLQRRGRAAACGTSHLPQEPTRSLRGDAAPGGGGHSAPAAPAVDWQDAGCAPPAAEHTPTSARAAGCRSISAAREGASTARRRACRRSGAKPRAGACPPLARCQGGARPAPGALPARGARPGRAAVWPSTVNSRLLALPAPFSTKAVGTRAPKAGSSHPRRQGKGSKAAGREVPKPPRQLLYAGRLLWAGKRAGREVPWLATAPPSPRSRLGQQVEGAGGQPGPAGRRLRLSIGFPGRGPVSR